MAHIIGVQVVHMSLLVAVCALLSSSAPVSDSLVVAVRTKVAVGVGHKATLPCWLNPSQSAEGLEVRWYLSDHFDAPIILYRTKKLEVASSYVGRVGFGLKDATSSGLKEGDVSLELLNVTLKEAGDYTCYVSSDQGYDSGNVKLAVTEMGATPLLSALWKDDMVNVSCGSEGWYPEPWLRWSDQKQDLTPKGVEYSTDSSGLLSVHSWILVSGSSEVSCSIGISDQEVKEARVRLQSRSQPQKQESGSWVAACVAFSLLIAVLALLGVLFFKKRALLFGETEKSGSAEEKEKLLLQDGVQPTDLARKHYEHVKLEETANPYIIIMKGIVRDAHCTFPDKEEVTCLTAVKGTSGFSSGQHYWEVSVGKESVGLKLSWWVGVTSATIYLDNWNIPPTASNGFWFLSSSRDRPESFQFSTEPNVLLPVSSRPQTVGVFLDYDNGELSFYNVEDKRLIGTLQASFKGEVFPFFNPGKGDAAPMEVLQGPVQVPFSGTMNSAD